VTITVIGVDAKALAQAQARHEPNDGISFRAVGPDAADDMPKADIAFCLALGPLMADGDGQGRALARNLMPGGLLCVLQPPKSAIFDCLLGTQPGWFSHATQGKTPVGRIAAARDGERMAKAAGLQNIKTHLLGEDVGSVVVAQQQAGAVAALAEAVPVALLQDWPALAAALQQAGHAMAGQASAEDLVFLAHEAAKGSLARCLAELSKLFASIQARKCRLWIVTRGLRASDPAEIDPLAEAIGSFARVAANEYPGIDLKLVDLALVLDDAAAAQNLAALIARPGAETEFLVESGGVSAARMTAVKPASAAVEAVRLVPGPDGAMAGFDWVQTARRAPEPGEIEIGIAAAGLNFRDVMLAMGLLDDDVLDDGMAGAVFGFECAGRVLRVGSAVTHLQPGDAVMGFGRESFATTLTADARVFTRVPDGIGAEAAATIPVAFLTAWYGLVQMAQIQPGEWVLIHGAAGGVGIAAMQIARLRGARIAATVSSPEKRALVAAYGAENIYNSRSTAFLDEIRAEIGGVDVVLNSLAGEAMQASLKCLKPFGRFIELGKRDYVMNTALGLRPFRRNLTYFGVDLDQLLAANLPLVERLLAEIATAFAAGKLAPLPHRAFDWFETRRAFQLMQSGGHIGKIIVRPAAQPVATRVAHAAFRPGEGVHLVVGGAGGFGFEAAAWLAERGATAIDVASRRGVLEPQLRARAEAIRATGTILLVETLDVTDGAAVQALIGRLERRHGRLAGVIHAAMVLDDGLIANQDFARVSAVLAPKVSGTENLDFATSGLALDYFVAFSSASAMLGNPGQGAYVAANGYVQGVMARRRAAGLPGLAVGWGAIADAGVLARNASVAASLGRVSGIEAMQSRAALAHLETLLAQPQTGPATTYCALFRPGEMLQRFKLLQSPTFATLFADANGIAGVEMDLSDRIAGKSEGDARALVAGLVAAEVARIFRLPPEDIELKRPLDELGLDSMMSLDLRMSIEKRFGVELPIVAIGAGVSLNDLAGKLIASLRSNQPRQDDSTQRLMQQHGLVATDLAAGMVARTNATGQSDVAVALV
jgi:NADPH:quinone reductase-like Zn-dependent oxidoreductase/acyl carrier protein